VLIRQNTVQLTFFNNQRSIVGVIAAKQRNDNRKFQNKSNCQQINKLFQSTTVILLYI